MTDTPPTAKAVSQTRIADFNQTVILNTIRHSVEGVSRVELAEAAGLSAQAVTNIVRQLISAGLITEGRRAPVARGKPRTLLNLSPGGQYAIGVHLDPAVITYVIVNLVGETQAHVRHPTPDVVQPDAITSEIAGRIDQLIGEATIPREKIIGVGIAAPGPIDIDSGVVVDPPNLAGWNSVPLRDAVLAAVDLPVLLDKDVTAAATAEKWLAGESNFAFFYMGTGVGAGLVLNDEVFRGRTHNSGQIGNMIVESDGWSCPCGYRGCLGEGSHPGRIVSEAIACGGIDHDVCLHDRHQVERALEELAGNARAGNAAALSVMEQVVRRILKSAEDLALLLDLDRVILGGPYWATFEPFFTDEAISVLQDRFNWQSAHPLTVSGTRIGEDVGAVGAASLVLDHTFSTNPAVLLTS